VYDSDAGIQRVCKDFNIVVEDVVCLPFHRPKRLTELLVSMVKQLAGSIVRASMRRWSTGRGLGLLYIAYLHHQILGWLVHGNLVEEWEWIYTVPHGAMQRGRPHGADKRSLDHALSPSVGVRVS
jgi:hypothetical protein